MKAQQQTACSCFSEVDRMIDEGLGNGTINPKYTEVHLKLKEKQEKLLSTVPTEPSKPGGTQMKTQQPITCSCLSEVDRMINEGLGNGTINPKYTEAHLKLKEKQEFLLLGTLPAGLLEQRNSNSCEIPDRSYASN